ncbi:hypothetical protein Sjap_021942 [Stephania japonica]|uniref:Uncharacterized protein n=1 Tax=Stephania japonica TaxID=461633 RepID=A0AAP0EMZ1_9MAGN
MPTLNPFLLCFTIFIVLSARSNRSYQINNPHYWCDGHRCSHRNNGGKMVVKRDMMDTEEGDFLLKKDEMGEVVIGEMRTMKDHVDVESAPGRKPSNGRDLRDIAGSLLSRASVFQNKLQKWRKQMQEEWQQWKLTRRGEEGGSSRRCGL